MSRPVSTRPFLSLTETNSTTHHVDGPSIQSILGIVFTGECDEAETPRLPGLTIRDDLRIGHLTKLTQGLTEIVVLSFPGDAPTKQLL